MYLASPRNYLPLLAAAVWKEGMWYAGIFKGLSFGSEPTLRKKSIRILFECCMLLSRIKFSGEKLLYEAVCPSLTHAGFFFLIYFFLNWYYITIVSLMLNLFTCHAFIVLKRLLGIKFCIFLAVMKHSN